MEHQIKLKHEVMNNNCIISLTEQGHYKRNITHVTEVKFKKTLNNFDHNRIRLKGY